AGPDYTLDQSATATLTVRPKAIMVTADNRGITYGQADAAFTSAVSGLVGSDQLTVPGTCGVSGSHTAAGSYPITCSGADGGGNYTISYAAGTLGVAKAVLTVNAPSPSTTYGVKASTVSLAPTYGGLVNADTPSSAGVASASCATAASVTSGGSYPAGSFPVTCSGPTGTANYTVHYSAGTLTVGSATLTVTARDASRPYGAADPAFTTTVSGLVNSDTASAAYSGTAATATTATATSPAGSYPITVASGTLTSTNYTFAFASGTLTVTAATTSLTAAAVLVTLGGHSAQVNVGTISATLRYGSSARPVVGATITFTARSIAVCAAVTDATGKATCSLTAVQDAKVISSLGYTATFVGSSDLLGSSGSAGLIQFR
ncbi:MAG: hypothetical protein QOG01_472, partial [Pseudonocardiales bacterium]|nr:hypothetical protein [Pseudonocardiales bacterium]